jgi:hypothetical protein
MFILMSPTAFAAGGATNFAPPTAKQDLACMVRALKAVPGVDRVRSGSSKDATASSPAGMRHLFVQYRYIDKSGLHYDIRFNSQDRLYIAVLPNGVHTEGSAEVNDWGTGNVIDRWKAHCGVAAGAISF